MKRVYKFFHTIMAWVVISMIVLALLPAYAAHADGGYVPNASGGLRIGVAEGEHTIVLVDEPALVKSVLDQGWGRARDEWNKHIGNFINEKGGQQSIEFTSDLATVDKAELGVTKTDNGLSLNYVLPNNQLRLTLKSGWLFLELSYVITFDLELILAVQAPAPGQRLRIADAALYLRKARIDGVGIVSDLVKALPEALLQNIQSYVEETGRALLPQLQEMGDQFIAAVLGQIPSDAIYVDIDVEPKHGAIELCFKANAMAICSFPAP
jgi:hypothetical protein